MGVSGLWGILDECSSDIRLEDLKDKKVAIDSSIWIYQLSSIQSESSFVFEGLFRRLCKLVYYGICPIFVFDGRPSELKLKTTRKRNKVQKVSQTKLSKLAKKALALRLITNPPSSQRRVISTETVVSSSESDISDVEYNTSHKRIAASSRRIFEFTKVPDEGTVHKEESSTRNMSQATEVSQDHFNYDDLESSDTPYTVLQDNAIFVESEVSKATAGHQAKDEPEKSELTLSPIVHQSDKSIETVVVDSNAEYTLKNAPNPTIFSSIQAPDALADGKNLKYDDQINIETKTELQELNLSPIAVSNIHLSLPDTKTQPTAYRLESEAVANFKTLLSCFGFSWLVAPSEAEAQCVHLQNEGDVEYVITDDSDAFLFGASTVIRNLFSKSKSPRLYELASLNLTQDMLIFLGSLLGTDYFEGISGVGPKKALAKLSAIIPEGSTPDFNFLLAKYAMEDKEFDRSKQFLQKSFYHAYRFPITDKGNVNAVKATINESALFNFLEKNTTFDKSTLKKEVGILANRT